MRGPTLQIIDSIKRLWRLSRAQRCGGTLYYKHPQGLVVARKLDTASRQDIEIFDQGIALLFLCAGTHPGLPGRA